MAFPFQVEGFLKSLSYGDLKDQDFLRATAPKIDFVIEAKHVDRKYLIYFNIIDLYGNI